MKLEQLNCLIFFLLPGDNSFVKWISVSCGVGAAVLSQEMALSIPQLLSRGRGCAPSAPTAATPAPQVVRGGCVGLEVLGSCAITVVFSALGFIFYPPEPARAGPYSSAFTIRGFLFAC